METRSVHEGFVPLEHLTTDIEEAVDGVDLIMLVVPSVAHKYYARQLAPLLTSDRLVFLNPGHTGGGLHFVHELRLAGYAEEVQTCETVTLTYICRMEGPATVGIYSYVRQLRFAAFPGKHSDRAFALLQPLYPEIMQASNVLEAALSNMNAVFHPPGVLMNAGWIEATDGDFLFYRQGITDAVGRAVSAIDEERMSVARALGVPARSFLESFHQAGLTTDEALVSGSVSRACRDSEPNKTITSPPSLDHRYIHEDVGYGLVPMAELGKLAGVATPTIDTFIHLAKIAAGVPYRKTGLTLDKMGLAARDPQSLAQYLYEGFDDQ
jgi:opine dehydrogenase